MSVVGIDLGYQCCHVAIVRHGGVEVIANEYSDRKSLSLVAFGEKRRLMGHSAKNQQIMNYKNTIYGFRDLLGRKFSDPYVQREIKNFPFTVVSQKNDAIGIKINFNGEESIFSPGQITAMMLTYLKKVAEKALGRPVADCVISVPSYFTDSQRRALLDSSAVAGFNCLRLFNDTTAAALAYGIYKQDLPAEAEKPRNVVFVDMGHSSLQVAICSFQKGKLNVLAKASNPNVGGRNFDLILAKHFAAAFKKKYNIDTFGLPKQLLRLLGEVEKVKKTMSTVTTPVPLNIECFYEDRDVSGSIKREVFIEICEDMLADVRHTLESALAKTKLALGDIDAVELIGGSCRVPAIKEVISDVFKRDLSTTLNLDEAVSRGCALQCAMRSPTFKVRDFNITDIQPYPIQLRWKTPGEIEDMVVYKEGDAIFHSKMLSFFRKEPFTLEASYASSVDLPVPDREIGNFLIKNVAPTEEGEASKIKIKVRMNIHGVFYVKDATLVEKQKQVEPPPEAMETDSDIQLPDVEKMAANEEKPSVVPDGDVPPPPTGEVPPPPAEAEKMEGTNDADGAPNEETPNEETPNEETPNEETPTDSPETEKKDVTSTKPPETKKPKKPTVKYVDLPIVSVTASMTKKEMDAAHETEVNLTYQDQLEQEKTDARNAVEEYVYGIREKLYELDEYITEKDKTAFSELLTNMENWLYDEGEDQPKKVYVEKLEVLKKSGDPVVHRQKEFLQRPTAFEELAKVIIHYEKILQSYSEGVELYNHIEPAEMDKVKEQIKTKREWHETQMQACQATPKHETPPVTCAQIRAEAMNLDSACKTIVTKPKPKPKEEPPKDDKPPEEQGTENPKMEDEPTKPPDPKMEDETTKLPDPTANAPSSEDMDLD